MTVRYAVVRTNGWAAWVIRTATRSEFNHALVVRQNGVTIEAQPGGLTRYSHGIDSYPGAVFSQPVTGVAAEQIWQWSVDHLGVGYGWLDIFAIALYMWTGWLPQWASRRLMNTEPQLDGTLICSQAVTLAFAAGGITLGDKPAFLTTPGDLFDVEVGASEPARW